MNAVTLTWYGHSCFLIAAAGARLLIDPFLTGNPLAPVKAEAVEAEWILVSHGHGDHVGDAVAIAKRTGATVIANFEIVGWLQEQGLTKLHAQHIGGAYRHPFGWLKFTPALHGSGLPGGRDGGNPVGFLFDFGGRRLYHACDTGLFSDMALIGEGGLDLAILPIGDNFTMGPDDAVRAVQFLKPRRVVPIHYGTFDVIRQDPQAFARAVAAKTQAECVVMSPGQSLEL